MKLLHVIGSMDPMSGGPCQGIRNSTPELERLGGSREIVSLDKPDSDFLGGDSFPIHAFGPSTNPWGYVSGLLPWLVANLQRFDVVILNGLWLYPGYALYKAINIIKRSAGKGGTKMPKFFIMAHGMLDPYFQKAPGRRLKAVRNWFYWKLIENRVIGAADGILFTCETELLLARESFSPYKPKKELNVGYGVQHPPDYNAEMKKTFLSKCPGLESSNYLLFLSRIHEKKGVDILVEAFNKVALKNLPLNIEMPMLVIAGPGMDSPYGKKIANMVSEFGLSNYVIFPGMLSGYAKWGAFYGCDAFVLASHQENFGIAVAEALACGKPALISNQVNIWREIESGGGGIVDDDTVEGATKMLMSWVAMSGNDKLEMGKRAYSVFKTNFEIVSATKKLFETLSNE